MIDVKTERVFPLSKGNEIAWLPKKYSAMTWHRWAAVGMCGIKLEVLKVGGVRHTSEGAVLRFFERLTAPGSKQDTVTPTEARRGHEAAMKRLKELGL